MRVMVMMMPPRLRLIVSVVVSVSVVGSVLTRMWPMLWVRRTHAESLGPGLHLDKANFSLTASTDKGN
jgi:hypothetical protein